LSAILRIVVSDVREWQHNGKKLIILFVLYMKRPRWRESNDRKCDFTLCDI